ncbi:MAG: Glutathione S-transferase GST-6.0 [Myxococcota bacterium]|nr:Glutathione S-transferase GST-6.0 [Myxococcota bacterium]
MQIKLYYAPKTRSTRPRWMLEELGLPYELSRVDLSRGEHKQPDYLDIHPLGVVPAIEIDGVRMIESVAICMQLADLAPGSGMAPPVGSPERAAYYQWLLFAVVNLEPHLVVIFTHGYRLKEHERNEELKLKAIQDFRKAAGVLETALEGKNLLVGDHFTTADLITASLLMWGRFMGQLEGFPNLNRYVDLHQSRPAYKRATS